METTHDIVAAEATYSALLNDPRRPLSRFVEASLAYGRMLSEPDPARAAEVLSLALETLHDPPADAEAAIAVELLRALRPVAARLGLAEAELDAIRRERRMLDLGLAHAAPGEREQLCRRAAAVRFAEGQVAEGFAELMDGLRSCSADGLDELATDLVLAVRRRDVPEDVMTDLELMWVELRRQRFDGNWPLWCLTALGALRLDTDDVVTAQMYVRRAESILGHLDRPVAGVLISGWVALASADYERAHDRFAYASNSATSDERIRLLAAAGLGEALVCLGRADEARAPLAEAIAYDIGDPFSVGRSHELLAEIAAAEGRHAEAYHHLQLTRRLEQLGRGAVPTAVHLTADDPVAAEPDVVEVDLVASALAEPAPVESDLVESDLVESVLVEPADHVDHVVDLRDDSADTVVDLGPAGAAAALVAEGLAANRFELYFQEIYDNSTRRAGAAEGLMRLHHPDGVLTPDVFLAGLTDPDLARHLCVRTLDQACETLVRWDAAGQTLAVVVNVAATQLTPELPLLVRGALARSGARADRLTLELDGISASTIDPGGINVLSEVRATGARIGIDRFGGEFRSIDTLLRLPVDVVKLDRSVFGGRGLQPLERRMVDTVVALAKAFGFEVIATGIETAAQFELQEQFGCHGAQGFLIGVPVPESEFRSRVARVA
ncbi:MAG: EAL domain-containing protein [Acidimicrobiales bacterium]